MTAGKLAKKRLADAVRLQKFMDRAHPGEDFTVKIGGHKVSGSVQPDITQQWGNETAREHYHAKNIIHKHLFDMVYWDGLEKMMNGVPEIFSVWVTK